MGITVLKMGQQREHPQAFCLLTGGVMSATYSLQEAAALICGTETKSEWLRRKLCAGRLPGFKVGQSWRMTQDDIDKAIETLRPARVFIPDVPTGGLTRTSARRLSA
jgi:hypothetical protein